LFGLQIAYTLQTLKGTRRRELQQKQQQKIVGDPGWIIPVMVEIARAFREGQTLDTQQIAERLGLPLLAVNRLAEALVEQHLLNRTIRHNDDSPDLALAKPPNVIRIADLLQLGDELRFTQRVRRQNKSWDYLERLSQQQRDNAGEMTLEDLVPAPTPAT